jgi:hypothetical protein
MNKFCLASFTNHQIFVSSSHQINQFPRPTGEPNASSFLPTKKEPKKSAGDRPFLMRLMSKRSLPEELALGLATGNSKHSNNFSQASTLLS